MNHPLVPIAAVATLPLAAAAPAHATGAPATTTSATRPPSSSGAGAASAATGTAQSRAPTLGTSSSGRQTGATGAQPGQVAAGAAAAALNAAPNASPTTAPAGGGTTAPGGSATSPPAGGARSSTTPTRPPALVGGPFGSVNQVRGTARQRSGHISALAIVIAAVGASLALACAIWGLARRRAVEPHWWLSFQHALAEAGYRASATWAEFTDWARLGH